MLPPPQTHNRLGLSFSSCQAVLRKTPDDSGDSFGGALWAVWRLRGARAHFLKCVPTTQLELGKHNNGSQGGDAGSSGGSKVSKQWHNQWTMFCYFQLLFCQQASESRRASVEVALARQQVCWPPPPLRMLFSAYSINDSSSSLVSHCLPPSSQPPTHTGSGSARPRIDQANVAELRPRFGARRLGSANAI